MVCDRHESCYCMLPDDGVKRRRDSGSQQEVMRCAKGQEQEMKKPNAIKRNLFAGLMEGVDAMKAHREGKVTLRTHTVAAPEIELSPGAEFFVAAREKFNVSRAVWANMLRVSPRTVEKWERGGQVSPIAATFVELVTQYPDTIERLQLLPRRVARPSSRRMQMSDAAKSAAARRNSGERTGKSGMSQRRSARIG
jgi:putative transcriptional regulator